MWIKRSSIVYCTTILILIILLFRLFYLSFGGMETKIQSASGGRFTTLTVYNTKGIIYDRNINALSGNQFMYYLVINPRAFDRSRTEYISNISDSDYSYFVKSLNQDKVFVVSSYEKPAPTDGVYVYDGTGRYPQENVCSHLIGYLDSDGVVGLSGVEKAYDSFLSCFSNKKSIRYSINALNGMISGLGIKPDDEKTSLDGLLLTLDKEISKTAMRSAMGHFDNGSVVIMDCNNGDIITLSSFPELEPKNIRQYIYSGGNELVNNALSKQTVGSVFKIIVAASALLNGFSDFSYECNGSLSVSDRVFSCQNKKVHGNISLDDAYSKSCNCYFIALGQLLGYDKIIETAELFGLGSSIRICKDIYSSSGVLPDDNGVKGLANLSIGQGELLLTPLDVCRVTCVISNGGYLVNPNLFLGTYVDGAITNKREYNYKSQVLPQDVADRLKAMSELCVSDGTGKNACSDVITCGGKTASAQTGRFDADGKEILNTYFTGFYPADNPKYAITVFASDGKSGSETCAPVFREICEFIEQNY